MIEMKLCAENRPAGNLLTRGRRRRDLPVRGRQITALIPAERLLSGKRRPKKRPQMRFMKKDPVKRFRKRLQTFRRKGSRVRKILTGLMYLLMKVFLDQAT